MEYIFYGLFSSAFSWIFLVAIIVLFIRVSNTNQSLRKLQKEVDLLRSGEVLPKVQTETYSAPQNTVPLDAQTLSNPYVRQAVRTPADESPSPVSQWFKENLLLKIGVLMIIVGFGWFVSYAFAHNWIGPVGRITLGVLVGAIITIAGTFRLGKSQIQGGSLTVLGSALTIITLVAGTYIYHFFSPEILLLFVFVISLYVSLTAVAYSSEKLAVYGTLVSLFAPLFGGGLDTSVLYIYLFVISVASIWISAVKNWESVNLVGITGVLLYSFSTAIFGGVNQYESKYVVLFTVYAISVLYLIVSIWNLIRNKEKATGAEVYLTLVNTAILLMFTLRIVPTVYQSLVIAMWMLVYAISGFFVFNKTKNENLFFVHSMISILLLAIATSIELQGQTLVIAYAIEAAIISVSAFIVTGKINISERLGLLMIPSVLMSFQSISSREWANGIFHSDFAVLFVIGVVLAVLGVFYKTNTIKGEGNIAPYFATISLATFYAFALVWLVSHSVIVNDDSAVFFSLFVYTVVGLWTHFTGIFKGNSGLKKYGMTLLILVVARLVFVDVWNMELVLRVVTFIVLGIMFMSTAFISKSQKQTV